ncbi:hypothetical protein K7I13_15110 [Brucepastera parasyntrophica]|uniref:hypothetical protein n=1 Tax=Brucepastera parasyntrophica TaxID=2880008 RepID=UPI00210BE445|nr:hypothetical protein [Brucepastera parasyntrophica]ULQ59757.1 hypothetical protein K7I13_15110 [Brucepastera parasyntrophica]
MTILDINNITRKENFIYYRREFTGNALYDLPGKTFSGQIEFVIETNPLGKKEIFVKLIDKVDYPLLQVISNLKEFILGLDYDGKLP